MTDTMQSRDTTISDRLAEVLRKGLDEEAVSTIKKQLDELFSDTAERLFWAIRDDLATDLAWYVQQCADRAIEEMFGGNEDMVRRYLRCEKDGSAGRYNPVFLGRLSEIGPIGVRKRIVEAHRELLVNERILDLEAQVAGLNEELISQKAQNADLIRRLNDALR